MSDIKSLQERNRKVEADKAWEKSWFRRITIMLITYGVIGGYLNFLNVEKAWLHALVPATGYMLSTLGLGFLKDIWISRIYTKP